MDDIRKKINLPTLQRYKKDGKKAVFITSYDYPLALLADRAGVDMILVGDSMGMTTLGYDSTLPVTMDDMIRAAQAVKRAAKYAFIVGDMPFMTYQQSDRDAIMNAGRFLSEAGCDAVKLEGGRRMAGRVRAIVDAGIVTMGHIGLTPQSMSQMGGYRVQGKSVESYQGLLDDAKAIEDAGAFFILLEATPSPIGELIQKSLSIPVYGIGAGEKVDGQLVIIHDIIGLFEQFKPKFIKRYCEAGKLIEQALVNYCQEVRDVKFPGADQCYPITDEELSQIRDFEETLKGKKTRYLAK